MSRFCVLVASSDSRRDIFDICFANADRIWADCDWPKYVGVNSVTGRQNFQELVAPVADGWCEQVIRYVNLLPPDISYILLMVEDCLFLKPVDGKKLDRVGGDVSNGGLAYLRLVPVTRNWLGRLVRKAHSVNSSYQAPFELISPGEPYYSSTEMAIWERSYLLEQLQKPGDAWSFEHHISRRAHWAVREPVFDQHQIVHKGKWHRRAAVFLAEAWFGYPSYKKAIAIENNVLSVSKRPKQSWGSFLRGEWQNLNFALFGFASFRIKRWLWS
jgi:hypothetical protein